MSTCRRRRWRDPGLADYLTTVLAETSVPLAYLRFDISEDSLVGDLGASREMLARLHAMGIRLILDDFGTGYASLSYLQFFPFDYLKIDRTFIRRLDTDARQNKVLGAVVQMASNLGLRAIAEGVETAAALQYLRQVGCEFAQGYWFAEPVSAEDALRHMQGRVSKFPHRETELPESPTVDKTMPLAPVPSLSAATMPLAPVPTLSAATMPLAAVPSLSGATMPLAPVPSLSAATMPLAKIPSLSQTLPKSMPAPRVRVKP